MRSDRLQLLMVAVCLALLILQFKRPAKVRAGGTTVVATKIKPGDRVELEGYSVVGFSCISSTECIVLSR
jgi:hypothetical protein